jgi:SAM-dependent methyltransferase
MLMAMGMRLRSSLATLRHVATVPHRIGRAQVLRDVDTWLRLQFLGVASQSGIGAALHAAPGRAAEIAIRAGLADVELVESFLRLGVALDELRERNGRFRLKGRRLRAVAGGDADDLAGLAEELVVYDSPIYQHIDAHLRGAPPGDYLAGVGDVIARSSRLAEHVVGPFLATVTHRYQPATVLDIGCGTGVNLRWIAGANPDVQLTGIDLDPDVLAGAERNLERWSLTDRCRLRAADLARLPDDLRGPFDLVLLAQNIYYWPPADRARVLRQVRDLSNDLVVVVTTTPGRLAFGRHLDLVLRVTEHSWRLPTSDELRADAHTAGFQDIELHDLLPPSGLVALLAR